MTRSPLRSSSSTLHRLPLANVSLASALAVSALSCLVACGGAAPAFSTRFADNSPSDVERLLSRIAAAPQVEAPPIVVGVTAAPTHLYAFDLESQRVLWNQPCTARHAPIVTGEFVVTQETGGIVARDLRTGAERFVIADDGMTLNGAAAYQATVAVVLTRGNGVFAESVVTLVQNGSVQWERSLRFTAGSPAVIGDVVLVPWGNQNVTALDLLSGDEFARVRVLDTTVGHVFRQGNHVFAAGEQGFFALDTNVVSGRAQDAARFAHHDRELPGRPKLIRDAYAASPMPSATSAEQRIRLSWMPTVVEGGEAGLVDQHLYLVFYRFVFALDPTGASASWVYTHDTDIVGSAAQAGGVLLADDAGGITLVAADNGARTWHASAALPSTAVSFGLDMRAVRGTVGDAPVLSVRDQLVTAAQDQDARLVPARVVAVEMLGAVSDPEATASLIDLCENTRITSPVRIAACATLSKRTQGGDQILAALGRHAAFLEGTTAPPIGALASAAVAANVPGAAGALVAHLGDPNTASSDLPAIVTALGAINDNATSQPLIDFLRLYHADADDEHLVTTLKLAVDVIVKLSGPVAIEVLTEVSRDALGNHAVREHAMTALNQLEAVVEEAERAAQAAAAPPPTAEEVAAAAAAAPPPPAVPAPPAARLTLPMIENALLPVRPQLRACLKVGERQYHSARVVLVIEDGSLLTVAVVPQATQGCIEALIRTRTFPATLSSARERIDYMLTER